MRIKLENGDTISLGEPRQGESKPKPTGNKYEQIAQKIEQDIASRGNIQTTVPEKFRSGGVMNKVLGSLEVAGAPFEAAQAMVANPMLEMQRGNFNPMDLAREAAMGASLQKRGQYGDVYRGAGVPEPIAAGAGLFLDIAAPVKVLKGLNNAFGKISKMSDKNVGAISTFMNRAADDAIKVTGNNLDVAYSLADDVVVDGDKMLNALTELPDVVMKRLEKDLGKIDPSNISVPMARKIKQFVGKYRPSAFGKSELGLAETMDIEDINKAYSGFKKAIYDSVNSSKGKKAADAINELDEAYHGLKDSVSYVRKVISDKTLKKPTKGGRLAEKVIAEGDYSARDAMNTIRSASKDARKYVNKAMRSINKYNKHIRNIQMAQHAINAATFGGAIGGIGGAVASKIYRRED